MNTIQVVPAQIAYVVRYEGDDRNDRFIDYYRRHHVPILLKFPGIRRLEVHTPSPSADPLPTNAGKALLMAVMYFDDASALARALASEARRNAREDMNNFPEVHCVPAHQAFACERFGFHDAPAWFPQT